MPPPSIRLPQTCPENKRHFTHVRILTAVDPEAWNAAGFDGPLYRPGARVDAAALGARPILLEFAGPQGKWRPGRQRDSLWLLWRYDGQLQVWVEIARALSRDWSWALVLRGPAIAALRPDHLADAGNMVDEGARGREVTEELLRAIDTALAVERPAVRALVLTSIYDLVAGRLVAQTA